MYKKEDLFFACDKGNLEEVKKIILTETNSASNVFPWSEEFILELVMNVLKTARFEIGKILLEHLSDVSDLKPYYSLLHLAAKSGSVQSVKMLLDGGADANAIDHHGRIPVFGAVISGNYEITKLLLLQTDNVNSRDESGKGLLYYSVVSGSVNILKLLLVHGAEVNCLFGLEFQTPLHFAVEARNEEIIEVLLSEGADINAGARDGMTSLHIAAKRGYLSGVDLLLKRGALVNSVSDNSVTPLHLAVNSQHVEVCELLLNSQANVDVEDMEGRTVLQIASEKGNILITEHILKHYPDLNNEKNKNALKLAVCGDAHKYCYYYDNYFYDVDYYVITKKLLEYGFVVNPWDANDGELIFYAVCNGYLRIVEQLVGCGVDINQLISVPRNLQFQLRCAVKVFPLHLAIKNGQEEMAELLINMGADAYVKDRAGKNSLMYAAEISKVKVVHLLLTRFEIDVNTCDEKGNTALHFLCVYPYTDENHFCFCSYSIETAKILLRKGANVNIKNQAGITALAYAVAGGDCKVETRCMCHEFIKLLLEFNADINSRDKCKCTPFHTAIVHSRPIEVLDTLLINGAHINAQDQFGDTPLHSAVKFDHSRAVTLLLEHGCDINITNNAGLTVLSYTSYKRIHEILTQHIIKLKSADLFVSERNLKFIKGDYADLQKKYEDEVQLMKKKIDKSSTSFYDLFCKGVQYDLWDDDNIMEALKSDFESKFPNYGLMIRNNFRKSEVKKLREDLCREVDDSCFTIFNGLPFECVHIVLGYLGNRDLRNLIAACEPNVPT